LAPETFRRPIRFQERPEDRAITVDPLLVGIEEIAGGLGLG
jgi:hypothetical protein